MSLNLDDGANFGSVYLDDVTVYSETLEDHLSTTSSTGVTMFWQSWIKA